jgi:riboflavin biosynthesis pyrimidine reductase
MAVAVAPPQTVALREPLRRLLSINAEGGDVRGRPMPEKLSRRYGGELVVPLRSDRPTMVANFVSTLDGVVAFDSEGASGGGEISGFHEHDRFVMGLLRALSDVVVVGAGTVRAAPDHIWTAGHVHPASAGAFRAWRTDIGLASSDPMTIILTNRGEVPRDHPGLRDTGVPVTILTTAAGARNARRIGLGPNVVIRTPATADSVQPTDVVAAAAELGRRLILCEGGPHILAQFLKARMIDELFLTLAPQLAGRAPDRPRRGLIEGTAFAVGDAPWAHLRSVHASSDHLFLRYGLGQGTKDEPPEARA